MTAEAYTKYVKSSFDAATIALEASHIKPLAALVGIGSEFGLFKHATPASKAAPSTAAAGGSRHTPATPSLSPMMFELCADVMRYVLTLLGHVDMDACGGLGDLNSFGLPTLAKELLVVLKAINTSPLNILAVQVRCTHSYRWAPKFLSYGSVCCACAQRPGLPRACHSG